MTILSRMGWKRAARGESLNWRRRWWWRRMSCGYPEWDGWKTAAKQKISTGNGVVIRWMSSTRVRVEGVGEDLRVGCPRLDLELVEGVGEGGCPRLELELKESEKVRGRCTRLEMELVEGVEEELRGV